MKKRKLNNFKVIKASGEAVDFDVSKLENSLIKSGAGKEVVNRITEKIVHETFDGITTREIYHNAFAMLKKISKQHAARYKLKQGIMELGPSGYPFETFVGKLLEHEGYKNVRTGQIMQGLCVRHEIDVLAQSANHRLVVECKFYNKPGTKCDVKVPLYVHSRFEDIKTFQHQQPENNRYQGRVVTNTHFSEDAIRYGLCMGLPLQSWDYPESKGIRDVVDQSGLYPLTCLTSLTHHEKQWLLENNFVLVKDIYNKHPLLRKAGVKEMKLKAVLDEGMELCNLKV